MRPRWNAAHAAAEAIRAGYGYSGGADGSEYLPLMFKSEGYVEEDGGDGGTGVGGPDRPEAPQVEVAVGGAGMAARSVSGIGHSTPGGAGSSPARVMA